LTNLIHSCSCDVFSKEVVPISHEIVDEDANLNEIFSDSVVIIFCFDKLTFDLKTITFLWLLDRFGIEFLVFFSKSCKDRSAPSFSIGVGIAIVIIFV
jgi:hypothetical protein